MDSIETGMILDAVAAWEGVRPQTVRQELEAAISAARESAEPAAQAFWRDFPSEHGTPTPEELVAALVRMIREQA